MKPGRKKEEGSIRSEGFATLGVSLRTRNGLKQLAADSNQAVSTYLRELVDRELQGKHSLTGMEKHVVKGSSREVAELVEQNNKIVAEMAELRASYSTLELAICAIANKLGIKKLDTKETVLKLIRSLKGNERPDQPELELSQ